MTTHGYTQPTCTKEEAEEEVVAGEVVEMVKGEQRGMNKERGREGGLVTYRPSQDAESRGPTSFPGSALSCKVGWRRLDRSSSWMVPIWLS